MERVVCLVADGFGVGEAPDAAKYGDLGSNTLAHVASAVGSIRLPNLQKLGLGNLTPTAGVQSTAAPLALTARLTEQSEGKDTTTGHWEIAGLVTRDPFALFPSGFPSDLVDSFVKEAGLPGVLGNRAASGTVIIDELGEEHLKSGKPILYTSGDSVFQVAANEESFGLERLYRVCEVARRLTAGRKIGRVIARPFVGADRKSFRRTEHRKDYSLPPGENCIDILSKSDVNVCSVGKIDDIFGHRGINQSNHTGNNRDSLQASYDFLVKNRGKRSFVFTNLVDFDMLYGHRRDAVGYARALEQLDAYLPTLLGELNEKDCLILTSDYGCDPTFRGTDHTREFVPLIAYRPGTPGGDLGIRSSFADIAVSLLDSFRIERPGFMSVGKSFF